VEVVTGNWELKTVSLGKQICRSGAGAKEERSSEGRGPSSGEKKKTKTLNNPKHEWLVHGRTSYIRFDAKPARKRREKDSIA